MTLVVKLGGAAGIDAEPLLRELAVQAAPWVLVHGGNEELSDLSRRLGHTPRFIESPSGHTSRFTDAQTLAHIQMAYRGRINNDLVLRLQRLGVDAVGLSGVDGGVWRARRKDSVRAVVGGRTMVVRDDLTGRIHTVDTRLLQLLLDGGYRPVLTLPALADTGEAVNVDGDRAAAATAGALGATDLIILSNVPGLLRDVSDPDSLIARIPRDRLDDFEGFAQGRFRKKLLGVREALDAGVRRVVLASAASEHPLRDALAGHGTVIE
jgi:acetylglutamate/LysW-gamma-L-alpha-aminoadipate kinase